MALPINKGVRDNEIRETKDNTNPMAVATVNAKFSQPMRGTIYTS